MGGNKWAARGVTAPAVIWRHDATLPVRQDQLLAPRASPPTPLSLSLSALSPQPSAPSPGQLREDILFQQLVGGLRVLHNILCRQAGWASMWAFGQSHDDNPRAAHSVQHLRCRPPVPPTGQCQSLDDGRLQEWERAAAGGRSACGGGRRSGRRPGEGTPAGDAGRMLPSQAPKWRGDRRQRVQRACQGLPAAGRCG